ncbi:hypothetical protein B0H14DRAFT_3129993 [Mycena olivaceomarginata]|nr:hypothetical protein B0H14DRAFT_3129993 [Mycena olivaceomarginata]
MSNANSSDSETPNHGVEPLRKGPIRCDNCSKTAKDAGRSKLSICSACSSAPYCSVECQRQHWKTHKAYCKKITSGELAREALALPIGDVGHSRSQGARTVGQALQDIGAWAQVHNGDLLTVVAWHALGLLGDIEARKSNILVLGLCRTSSSDPKTYYTLKDVGILPVADAKRIFKGRLQHPSRILKDAEKQRQADGAIGAMLVISVEQAGDDNRTVLEAVSQSTTCAYQPLGVFEVHRTSLSRVGQLPEAMWKACLANVLRGGLLSPHFRTS